MATLAVFKQEHRPSIHGGYIWEIHAVDIDTRKEYKTYLDPENDNWHQWQPLIENPNQGVLIEGEIKFKRNKPDLIDADTRPDFTVVPANALADMLGVIWRVNPPRKINDIFEEV